MMQVQGPLFGQSSVCAPVLRALPQWFGIEEATREYIRAIDGLPTFLAQLDGQTIGFLSLQEHTPYAAEVHVTGVLPAYHRRGAGRALLAAAEVYLRGRGSEFLQVKTLSAVHPDPYYARTRAFYLAAGFRPLQEFSELWGPANPCLMLIKWLGVAPAGRAR